MRGLRFLFAILLGWSLARCDNASPDATMIIEVGPSTDTLLLSGQRLVLTKGEKGLPEMIYHINKKGLRYGYAMAYNAAGELLSISNYQEGLQDGSTFVFDEDKYLHRIFSQGTIIYESEYQDHQKIADRLYPQVVEEFFFEDKYYAKIKFPISYAGDLEIKVTEYQVVVVPFPDQTYQLVINDALDLADYNLELTYQPAVQDTLLGTKYPYKHVVYGE